MSMLGLAPPPLFLATPGRPAVAWPQWLRIFENFLLASGGLGLHAGSPQGLLHSLGVEGQRICYTLPLPSSDKAKPDATQKDCTKCLLFYVVKPGTSLFGVDAIKALGLQMNGSTRRCLKTTMLPTTVEE
ncbi:hypothetical protein MTO96_029889 [Rhipicephalus appendiculatus]